MPIKEESTDNIFFKDKISSLDTKKTNQPKHNNKISQFISSPLIIQAIPSHAIVPQDQCPKDQGKFLKVRENAAESLANNFDIIPIDDCAKQILNNCNRQMRVQEFTRRLQQYDMNNIFNILQFPDDYSNKSLPDTLNYWSNRT